MENNQISTNNSSMLVFHGKDLDTRYFQLNERERTFSDRDLELQLREKYFSHYRNLLFKRLKSVNECLISTNHNELLLLQREQMVIDREQRVEQQVGILKAKTLENADVSAVLLERETMSVFLVLAQ